MVERSLQASQDGIQIAKAARIDKQLTQQALANALQVTRQPISKFFNGKPVDQELFVRICKYLGLNWQEIALRTEVEPKANTEEIDRLVQEVREGIRSLVKERCGTMRVLDMTQPIQLTGEGGIYTNVNILKKIPGRRTLEIAQLFENVDLEEFERFGLSAVREKRVPGIEAVRNHCKLMVLGKPGAGKTTFLKYLAMNCIEGNFLADHVPIFITLKDFAEADRCPDLLTYIETQITKNVAIREIVQQGRSFVLLDGLDEVREEDTKRVLQEIKWLSQQFPENHFVITCRIAAKEYVFEKFTEVEVSDFDDEQISTFVHNWFRCKDPEKAEATAKRILERLDANKPIKELASSPLLLTLLCLECEESLEFPRNRADLYDRGLKVLLSKWDASRKIERHQIYEKLSLNRKEDLLSQLARKTFEQKDYFFKQRTVEQHISDYIINLPGADTDPQALLIDSGQVLKAIEANHGLLVERARGIYSFSHLTFQEYFTAREIVKKSNYEKLVEHLTDKRWREVFLLSANMMLEADPLLLLMKASIDALMQEDQQLQAFLKWVSDKSKSVNAPYRIASVRAFYLALSRNFSLTWERLPEQLSYYPSELNTGVNFQLAHTLDIGLSKALERAIDKEIIDDRLLDLSILMDIKDNYDHPDHYENHSYALESEIDKIWLEANELLDEFNRPERDLFSDLHYDLLLCQALCSNKTRRFPTFSSDLFPCSDYYINTQYPATPLIKSSSAFKEIMKQHLDKVPLSDWARSTSWNKDQFFDFEDWWTCNKENWVQDLRSLMCTYRDIAYDWQLSSTQKILLQQYYDANRLLVDCLNSDCYVSRDVRQEIEETLLLPMAEIEKRKKDQR